MAEASFQDLQMAINGFNTALKDYSIQSAITSATEQVKQLNQSGIDEADRRNKADLLARDLALQLTGVGASGQQISSAFSSIAPKDLNTPLATYQEGLAKDSKPLQEQATKARDFQNYNAMELAKLKMLKADEKAMTKQSLASSNAFLSALEKSQAGFNREAKGFKDKVSQIDMILNAPTSTITDRLNLTTLVKSVGQDVGNIGEKEAEAALGTTLYGKIKSYSNFVTGDAASAITPQQAIEIKKVMKVARERMSKEVTNRSMSYSKQLKQKARVLGRNISDQDAIDFLTGFDMPTNSQPQQQPTTSATTSMPASPLSEFLTPINK